MSQQISQRIALLSPLLKDSDPSVCHCAAESIEILESKMSIQQIVDALKNGNRGQKIAAIYALGKIGGEQIIKPLLYCANLDDEDVKVAAIKALGETANNSVIDLLSKALDDKSQSVQAAAITALANFDIPQNIASKIRLFLHATDGILEGAAAVTLAKKGDIASLPDIITLLSSDHAETRKMAAKALSILPL